MFGLWSAQNLVLLILGVAAFALEVFALVDAVRHSEGAYVAAGKRTKRFWSIVLLVAVLVGFVTLNNVLSIGLLGVVAAGVYLADVRPALQQVSGRGGTHGPYGPW